MFLNGPSIEKILIDVWTVCSSHGALRIPKFGIREYHLCHLALSDNDIKLGGGRMYPGLSM